MDINPEQELFCQYYIKNDAVFGNATLAYSLAYDFKLDELSNEPEYDTENHPIARSSEHDKAYDTCSVNASRLLRQAKINDRVKTLLNEILTDDVVDSELARIIKGARKDSDKIAAIKEYNALRQRITNKTDLTSGGDKLDTILVKFIDAKDNRDTEGVQTVI